jgi:hypothetical protein
MQKKLICGAIAALAVLCGISSQAQSYSNAVMALGPAAYWPLSETAQPPFGSYLATNLGTAGANANGFYETWFQPYASGASTLYYQTNSIQHVPGAINDGDTAMQCTHAAGGNGQYVVFPRFTNGVANPAVTLVPPFSIELWAYPTTVATTVMPIVNEGRNPVIDASTGYTTNGEDGFSLGQYGTIFYFATWNNRGPDSTKQEIDTALTQNAWQHMVINFDGTNQTWFKNGVQVGTRAIPASAANAAGQRFTPDLTSPLLIGTGSIIGAGNGGTEWAGSIDEVAIYTNTLDATSIRTHYVRAFGTNVDGTAATASYANTVLGNIPTVYVRLDEPAFNSYPAPATYPVATNYGLAGASANGFYQPGTAPGVAGPPYSGFGGSSRAVSINGVSGGVDIGGGNLPADLNRTNNQPLTVAAWFQGSPADAAARFQEIVGHGNSSWRIALDNNAGTRFNPGNGPELQFASMDDVLTNAFIVNDGGWHFVAGVSDGTNDSLYIDGALARTGTGVGSIAGSTVDAFIGGDPGFLVPTWNGNVSSQPRYFEGQIAHVAFFTNALSAAQIQQLYSAAGVPPFVITQPPLQVTNNSGANVSIPIGAKGSPTLTYQWYQTNVNSGLVTLVPGQTGSSLVFNPVSTNNQGSYFAVVSNSYGAATSSVVQLTILGPPIVTLQSPTDIRVFVGTTPTLHVTATGPSLKYQWASNSSPISGATNSSYTVTNTASTGTSTYTCAITNFVGSTSISPITVAVLADPIAPYPVTVLADHPANYFRLDEADTGYPNNGVTAYDYAGGDNGNYGQTYLSQPGYSTTTDYDNSAGFGLGSSMDSCVSNVSPYLSFTASNSAVNFSVECWINASFMPNTDAGIVTIGYGFGGEELNIDCGANTTSRPLRFYVNSATGVNYKVNSSFIPYDGRWHHIVAVCNQTGGLLSFYADGNLLGTTAIPNNAGIRNLTAPLSIGSRLSTSAATDYDNQFYGYVDDVAIYNYALSAGQVQAHYFAAGIPPTITQTQPASLDTNQNATATFTVTAGGTAPLSYFWYDPSSTLIAGQTTATLTLANLQPSQSGTYSVTVSNVYGTATTNVFLNVNQGPPVLTADLQPTNVAVYAGVPITYTVTVSGSPPFAYQWLRDGSAVPGATTSSYSFNALQGTNTYQCRVTNSYSAGTPTLSAVGTVAGMPAPTLDPLNYNYKMKVTFKGYNRGEALADFPALVRFNTNLAGFAYSQFASPSGGDLRFTDAGGTREIPHEIDEWNPNGESEVWVQVTSLSSSNDFVWAYWGNPAATTPNAWSTNGGVWVPQPFENQPAYQIVYHLKEGALPFADSTTLHNATNGNAPAAIPGIVGTGGAFTGTSFLDAGTNNVGDAFTLSAWLNVPAVSDIQTIWANQHGGYGAPGFALWVNSYQSQDGVLDLATGIGGTGSETKTPSGTFGFGQWHQVQTAINRTNGTAVFYLDGNQVAASSIAGNFTNYQDLYLGRFLDGNFGIHGTVDEARIRSDISSSNWVWASYMTVASNSVFSTYGAVSSSLVTLNEQLINGKIVLSWSAGTLQAAPNVTGTYTNVPGATSPYTNNPTGGSKYFRVQVR